MSTHVRSSINTLHFVSPPFSRVNFDFQTEIYSVIYTIRVKPSCIITFIVLDWSTIFDEGIHAIPYLALLKADSHKIFKSHRIFRPS